MGNLESPIHLCLGMPHTHTGTGSKHANSTHKDPRPRHQTQKLLSEGQISGISGCVYTCSITSINCAKFKDISPSWGQNWGRASGISWAAWCWHTMLAISCRHCCDPARCRADRASLPMMSHLGTKSLLGAWCAPSTLPGSPGMGAAGILAAPSAPPRVSLKLRLLDKSWGRTPSIPAPVITRSWGDFNLMLGFPPRRLVPLLNALAAVPPVLSSLVLHLPRFFPDKEFCFSQSAVSLLGSWLLWSGSLDRRVFLWGERVEKEKAGQRQRGTKNKKKQMWFNSRLVSSHSVRTFWTNTTEKRHWFTIQEWHKVNKDLHWDNSRKSPEGRMCLLGFVFFPSFLWSGLFLVKPLRFCEANLQKAPFWVVTHTQRHIMSPVNHRRNLNKPLSAAFG